MARPLLPGAPHLPGDVFLRPRVYPDDCYVAYDRLTLGEKTSFGVGRDSVSLVAGARSRMKILEVAGADPGKLERLLARQHHAR